VSGSDEEPPKPDYDRMSIGSLKRELAEQQAQRTNAREEELARIRDEASGKRLPWRMLAMVLGAGVLAFVIFAVVVRSSFPEVAEWTLPHFVLPPRDAGPPPEFVHPTSRDAGAAEAPHHASHPRPHRDAGPRRHDDLDLGEGLGDDPIGGI
jgi:hypothetical protein